MDGSPRAPALWIHALGLAAALGGSACRGDPEALFAEAEELRLRYEKSASEEAILKYRDARKAWIRDGQLARAATASRMLGATEEQLGLLAEAKGDYAEAAAICGGSCDPLIESSIRSDIGLTQAKLADSDGSMSSALENCQRALSLAKGSGGVREEARALTCAGEVEYHRGNPENAIRFYRRARPLWEKSVDPLGRAEALFYEGTALSDLSRFEEARANLESALSLWSSSGDPRGAAIARVALGRLEHRRGESQSALNRFREALDQLELGGDLVWEASGLAGIGNVYLEMGNGEQALSYWEDALSRIRRTGLRMATLDLTVAIGKAHMALDEPSEALRRFQEGLALAEQLRSHRLQAYSLYFMSVSHRALGQLDESQSCIERALALSQSERDPRLEAAILTQTGSIHRLRSRYERAVETFGRAIELAKASDDRVGESMALFGMAQVARARNDLSAAKDYLERALDVAESLRTAVESLELRSTYFASVHRFHELYVDVLMRLHEIRPREGHAAAAFEASERARARSLLDRLAEAGVDIRASVDPRLLERAADSRRRLDASVERRVRSTKASDEKETEALEDQIRDLQAEHDLDLAEIRSQSPRHAALAGLSPLGLDEIQKRLLDVDTVVLEYALGDERSFMWAVTKEDLASFVLPPRADIEAEAKVLYELLTARARVGGESLEERARRLEDADEAYWEAATRSSRKLLGPVVDRIAGKKLVVIADGGLHYLPFGALPHPARERDVVPLIVSHEVVNLPSASALAVLRQKTLGRERPKGTVAVFADPVFAPDDPRLDARKSAGLPTGGATPESELQRTLRDIGLLRGGETGIARLPATRQEAEGILALAPRGTTFQAMDFDAARSAAMGPEIGRYRMVHFATHGIANVDHPAMSGILLSMFDERGGTQEGFLRMQDIYDLDLRADLVVLSACNTALGKQIRGEGMVGIVSGFLYAGAERVVASLWKVDDEATRELMTRFYREMLEANKPPPSALRSAQLALWGESERRPPFFWAAFVLQGEWRAE